MVPTLTAVRTNSEPSLNSVHRGSGNESSTPSTGPLTPTPGLGPEPTTTSALAAFGFAFSGPGIPLLRSASQRSAHSTHSAAALSRGGSPVRNTRARSSTLSSLRSNPSEIASGEERDHTPGETRSLRRGFFTLPTFHRRDSSSVLPLPAHFSHDVSPAASSPVLPVEPEVVPERVEGDTPEIYLERLEKAVSKSALATVLSRSDDPFHKATLKTYLGTFEFALDPLDMALRKLLMELHLPKETQQIDRVLEAFAVRYSECNPNLFPNAEIPYVLAFSLMMLHTDAYNKSNKHKMTKMDYVRNTRMDGLPPDVLECFYDNITYTPFIHIDDDVDINGNLPLEGGGAKRNGFSRRDEVKKGKGAVDPYTLILEGKLETLRPDLGAVLRDESEFSYMGTAPSFDVETLHKAFTETATLQIVSPRSRPGAFLTPAAAAHPQDTDPGLVDVKVTKVGILSRKEDKKRGKASRAWREWGVILTGSQVLFFKNVQFVRSLIRQYEKHRKHGNDGETVTFHPPVQAFSPDAMLTTVEAVAVYDKINAKKGNSTFRFVSRGGTHDVFKAESEEEMNDWIAKINYAASFRTAGVRMRGIVMLNEGGPRRGYTLRRAESQSSASTGGHSRDESQQSLAAEITAARRTILRHKLAEFSEKMAAQQAQLEADMRTARNLRVLTPIQSFTREKVIEAAQALATRISWVRIEQARLLCHQEVLSRDLAIETGGMEYLGGSSADVLRGPPSPPRRSHTEPPKSRDSSSGSKDASDEISENTAKEWRVSELRHRPPPSPTPSPLKQSHTAASVGSAISDTGSLNLAMSRAPSTSSMDSTSFAFMGEGQLPPLSPKKKASKKSLNLSIKRKDASKEKDDELAVARMPTAGLPRSSPSFKLHGRNVSLVKTPEMLSDIDASANVSVQTSTGSPRPSTIERHSSYLSVKPELVRDQRISMDSEDGDAFHDAKEF
ncbi:hypothetical protein YB2330_001466 [Saitoella coloradoensis]